MSTIVVSNRSFCARSSAFSRSLSSANATAAETLSTSSGSLRERLVVQERADPPAVALDDRDRCPGHAARGRASARRESTQRSLSLEPEREPERRVAERLGDRGAERPPVLERDHQPGDRAAGEPAPEDPEEERERHGCEEHEKIGPSDVVRARRERPRAAFAERAAGRASRRPRRRPAAGCGAPGAVAARQRRASTTHGGRDRARPGPARR